MIESKKGGGSFYRKYKPQVFDEVIGQKVPIKILKKLVEESRRERDSHHCVLFSGIYGIGKTLLAHIFAKAINCQKEKLDYNPCLKCYSCIAIEGECEDFYEIDGATYTGIDNIRKIIDDTKYLPTTLKYKIYIIDEVHRLSGSAFDSLLKTLENPPSYVKFILATTDREKIPDTILSRCLTIPFFPLPLTDTVNLLKNISSEEGVKLNEEIISSIAEKGEGSIRDSLSLLELVIKSDIRDTHSFMSFFKIVSSKDILDIFKNIMKGQIKEAINHWHILRSANYDEQNFMYKFSEILTKLFLAKEGNCQEEDYLDILKNYKIDYSLLVSFWDILITQSELLRGKYDRKKYYSVVEISLSLMGHIIQSNNLSNCGKNILNDSEVS